MKKKPKKNTIMVLILGGPEQSQELDSAIPVGLFQCGIFCGSESVFLIRTYNGH